MAVNLRKMPQVNIREIREIAPIHLLDEEETTQSPAITQSEAMPGAKAISMSSKSSKMGILEKQQTLINNRKEIVTKIKQTTVFKTKQNLKPTYYSSILEQGHRIMFCPSKYSHYGLSEFNLTKISVDIYLLLTKSTCMIEFNINQFDDLFEPDLELSKLYSSSAIVRLFRYKQINAYLQSIKSEILGDILPKKS